MAMKITCLSYIIKIKLPKIIEPSGLTLYMYDDFKLHVKDDHIHKPDTASFRTCAL